MEFECIWREHERTGTPRCILTDQISDKINEINDGIQNSSIWKDKNTRIKVLKEAIPQRLQELVGLEEILSRVPESYIRAVFGAHLASNYVYEAGLNPPDFRFFEHLKTKGWI